MEIRQAQTRCIDDVMFRKVGADIALGPPDSESSTDSGDSYKEAPARALAVSNKFGLTFYADSTGFGVAKTTDLVMLSKELKNASESCSIKDKCISHVKLSRIRAISLSHDELTLAVCAGDSYQLVDVISLAQKSGTSSFEQEVVGITSVSTKDFCWSPSDSKTYLVLSTEGKLYSGSINASPKSLVDGVTAVCWSPNGRHVAYSIGGKSLVITTSNFSSSFNLELPELPNLKDDLDFSVDTLKWVQPSSLLICFAGADTDGEILECPLFLLTSASEDLAQEHAACFGLVFEQLFPSVESTIPFGGSGPFMLAEYLEPWQMLVATCRKSIDDHIVLLGWFQESESSEPFTLEVVNDAWIPRIELPDDGGDNAVTGLAIDRTTVTLELLDPREESDKEKLPPCPVLMCTTLEGKLSFFSFCRLEKKWQDLQIMETPSKLPESVSRSVPRANIAEKPARQSILEAESIIDHKSGHEILEKGKKSAENEFQKGKIDQTRMGEEQAKLGSQASGNENVQMLQEVRSGKSGSRLGGAVRTISFPTDKKFQSSLENNSAFSLSSTKSATSKTAPFSLQKSPGTVERFSSVSPTGVLMQRQPEVRSSGITDMEAYFLSELDTVNKMANEINALISSIEGKDLSKKGSHAPTFKKEAFDKLEHGISSLSDSCKLMKNELEQQKQLLEELHDESMQVDAWRTYVQSLLEQAADHRHQELWKCQKLHPEMDAIRKRVRNSDQVVKQQIADLESHLHNLELNEKQIYGRSRSSKLNQKSGHFQSLQYLYNTVNTQLAAAEQLAGCLAQQMEELNISSPQPKKCSQTRLMVLDIVNESAIASSNSSFQAYQSEGGVSNQGKTLTSYSGQTPRNMHSTPPKSWQLDSGLAIQDSVRRRRDSMDSSWVHVGAVKTTVERSARVRPAEKVANHVASGSQDQLRLRLLNTSDSSEKNQLSPTARIPQAVLPAGSYSLSTPTFSDVSRSVADGIFETASGTETVKVASGSTNFAMGMSQVSVSTNMSTKPFSIIGSSTALPAPVQNVRVSTPPTLSMKVNPFKPLAPHSEVPKLGSSYETRDQPVGNIVPKPVSQPKRPDFLSTSKSGPSALSSAGFNQFSFGTTAAFPIDSSIKTQPSSSSMDSSRMSSAPVPPGSTLAQVLKKDTLKFQVKGLSPTVQLATDTSLVSTVSSPAVQAQNATAVAPLSSSLGFEESAKVSMGSKRPDVHEKPTDNVVMAAAPEPVASAAMKTVSDLVPTSSPSFGFGQFSMSSLNGSFAPTSSSLLQSTVTLSSTQPMVSTGASLSSSLMASSFMQTQESLPSAQKQFPFSGASFPSSTPAVGSSSAEIHEEDMEEATNTGFSDFGGFGGLGLGANTQANSQKVNAFGGPSFSTQSGTNFSLTAPTGQLFRPAAFALPAAPGSSPQLGSGFNTGFSQGLFSQNPAPGGFGSPTQPSASGFGQPSQLGPGQQALGSALGAFGQTRQMGMGQMSSIGGGFGSISGGGFAAVASGGGFSNAATGGAFAGVSSAGGFQAFSGAKGGGGSSGFGGSTSFASQQPSAPQASNIKFQMRK
ncbi:hypothetical protein O6H91_08G031600 [Diphasiastrum complanatum]|uniref:Uncharacterized protein n=1 Tax=Diphasiastrum complanatum TaxID=34168 RepID=A0ACC2CW26_DIPCM|nr:hypothetical protein O6H91_08G031600 [Diphasiastrum complanatum]